MTDANTGSDSGKPPPEAAASDAKATAAKSKPKREAPKSSKAKSAPAKPAQKSEKPEAAKSEVKKAADKKPQAKASATETKDGDKKVRPEWRYSWKAYGIAAAVAALVVANLLVVQQLSIWQDEAAQLEAANHRGASATAELEVLVDHQREWAELLESQADAVDSRLPDLESEEESSMAKVDAIRAAVDKLIDCHDVQVDLIAYYWTTSSQSQGGSKEGAMIAKCNAAKTAFNAVKVESHGE